MVSDDKSSNWSSLPLFQGIWEMLTKALPFHEREGVENVSVSKGKKAWSSHLRKAVICFNSWKSLLSGHQLVHRSSWGLVLSLDVIYPEICSLEFCGLRIRPFQQG